MKAHIRVKDGVKTEQTVREHVSNVAKYTAEALRGVGLSACGELAGYLHDAGKSTKLFLTYIEKAANGEPVERGSVNHTFAGVCYLFDHFYDNGNAYEKLTCEIIAYAIGAHHGQFDIIAKDGKDGFLHRLQKDRDEICYEEAIANFLDTCLQAEKIEQYFHAAVAEIMLFESSRIKAYTERLNEAMFSRGLLTRLILSALIDADRRDTGEFMESITYPVWQKDMTSLWTEQLDSLEKDLLQYPCNTEINHMRRKISDTCKDFAERECGIYRLQVPTGAGKTKASLRYALKHAEKYNKKRIVYVIPFLGIADQTANTISRILTNKELLLVHHSNVIKSEFTEEEMDKYELTQETWENPIIVTTLVQLLNTLFDGKTTSIRRMKSLCDSVIIFDEVQSIPKRIISMFSTAINFLCYGCNATVLLCSATQPGFEKVGHPIKLSVSPDVIPYEPKLWKAFQRTEIINRCIPGGYTYDKLAEMIDDSIQKRQSVLAICNTKAAAKKLYEHTKKQVNPEEIYVCHLSTSMCMKHRLDILERINEYLKRDEQHPHGRQIICISTQLVEAGIDFSFEHVIRVIAGMDNIVQAAGRCNRNGEFGYPCEVTIVNVKEENLQMLKEIKLSQGCTEQLLMNFEENPEQFSDDLQSNEAIKKYYDYLFRIDEIKSEFDYSVQKLYTSIYAMLSKNETFVRSCGKEQAHIMCQAFKEAGEQFSVFDENTIDVIVPYDEKAKQIIKELLSERAKYDMGFVREQVKEAKLYTVSLFQHQYKKLKELGGICESYEMQEAGDEKDSNKLPYRIVMSNFYNDEVGIDMESNRLQIL